MGMGATERPPEGGNEMDMSTGIVVAVFAVLAAALEYVRRKTR